MTIQANSNPTIEVITVSAEEWSESLKRALKRLGLTLDQLKEQARRQDFTSTEARKLWLTIVEQD